MKSKRISIKHVEGENKILFVAFSAHSKVNRFDWYYDLPIDSHKLFLLDQDRKWYFQYDDEDDLTEYIRRSIELINPKYTIGIGSSAGASAALYYGSVLKFNEIHAFGPICIFNKLKLEAKEDLRWSAEYDLFKHAYPLEKAINDSESNIHLYVCKRSLDRLHVEHIKNLNSKINTYEIDCKNHRVAEFLKLNKRLHTIIDNTYHTSLFKANQTASVTINGECRKFSELIENSEKIADSIQRTTSARDVVLITGKTSFISVEHFLACILSNRIPCFTSYQTSKVSQEVFEKRFQNAVKTSGAKLFVDESGNIFSVDNDNKPLNNEDTMFMQMSSGTTALPKVLKVNYKSLINQVNAYSKSINFTPQDSVISWLPLYHDMGLIACLFIPLLVGADIHLIDPFDWIKNPYILLKNIEQNKPTYIWMPNFAFSVLSKLKNLNDISSIKKWISCSEVTRYKDICKFCENFNIDMNKISVCYAMAENVFAISQQDGIKTHNNHESCGKCIPGSNCYVKISGEKAPDGVIGDIWIDGNCLVSDLNKPYLTGDAGFKIDGDIYVIGRSDDMIIHSGKNISPYEIEHIISEINGIKQGRVACFGLFNENFGTENIVACAEKDENEVMTLSENEITKIVREYTGVSISLYIKESGWLIKTSSGKMSRKAIREKFLMEHHYERNREENH